MEDPHPGKPVRARDSRAAILDAARAEFADRGFDGVRIEHVARRAGFNKALVYRHFGDKRGLFDAMLKHCFEQREAILDELPSSLEEMLVFWSRAQARDREFLTIIQREAMQDDGAEPIEAGSRRDYYRRQTEQITELQRDGVIDPDFDAETLFLALLGVTVAPVILPQIARLACGATLPDEEFRARWEATLERLARALAPPPK